MGTINCQLSTIQGAWMLDFLNRHLVQPAVALKRNSSHLHFLQHLEKSQFESPAVIQSRQLELLKLQLQLAYENVPHYRHAWDAAGLHPSQIRSLGDLSHWPILTKNDIRQAGDKLLSGKYDASKLRVKKTSGSTGVPLTIRIDEPAVQWKYACTLRADQWSGWRLGQRVAKVWGNPEYRHFGWRGRLSNWLIDRAVYLDTCHLTDARIDEFVSTIRQHRPGLIFGHAHSLYLLACQMRRRQVTDVKPNGIISTAMPLHQWQRAVIEQVFNTSATDRYGCEEVSLIACECEKHSGLHLAAESVYTEVMPDGSLVVTDLLNRAMPLIRYKTGDTVTQSPTPCSCGRGLPTLQKVQGREADYVVTPSGALISGISLTENFALHIEGTAQVQIIQETRTLLRIRLVADDNFTPRSRKKIADLVHELFGPTMKYEVELVESIPQVSILHIESRNRLHEGTQRLR
jgi:phenylacetate-CoA ligase